MTLVRASFVVSLLLLTSAFTSSRTAAVPPQRSLDTAVPETIAEWRGVEGEPIDPDTRRQLAADAYLTRSYDAASATPVGLYIAYYARQRPNVSIQSPLHCLPGTGWEPLDVSTIDVNGAAARARRMLVRKGLDRAVILYWYAIHGRTVASELASKYWLLRDSLLYGRSDASLVRVSVPVQSTVETADREALAFGRALLRQVTF